MRGPQYRSNYPPARSVRARFRTACTRVNAKQLPCLNQTRLNSTCSPSDMGCACEVLLASPLMNGCAMESCTVWDAFGLLLEPSTGCSLGANYLPMLSCRHHKRNCDGVQHPHARQRRPVVRDHHRPLLDCTRLHLAAATRQSDVPEEIGTSRGRLVHDGERCEHVLVTSRFA
jgi:hypothetical protein